MTTSYQIQIDLTVDDLATLKAYAFRRAAAAGLTQAEFAANM